MRTLALAAGSVLGCACVPVAAVVVAHPVTAGQGHHVLALVAVWVALAGASTACFFRAGRRAALIALVGIGVAIRVASLTPVAPLSDDLYRYAWDGRVQAHGIDPYRYSPDAPQLAFLRDPGWLWPVEHCHPAPATGCTLINRQGVHTIYPPAAEAYYLALDATGVTRLKDRGLEGAGLVIDLALLAVLLAVLRSQRRDPRWAALWALSPLPCLEFVADAHVDGLALLLTIPALELARRHRPAAAGAVLALAALVKLYPALLIPALLVAEWPSVRRMARTAAAFVAVFALGYLPHVLAVGTAVVGYLPGYLKEEHYDSGTRYLVLADLGVTGDAATGLVVVVLAAAVGLVLRRRPPPLLAACWLYGTLLLLVTPRQPWYAVGLALLGLLASRPEWALVALAAYPIYVATISGGHDPTRAGEIAYGLAFVVITGCAVARRRTAAVALPPRRILVSAR